MQDRKTVIGFKVSVRLQGKQQIRKNNFSLYQDPRKNSDSFLQQPGNNYSLYSWWSSQENP